VTQWSHLPPGAELRPGVCVDAAPSPSWLLRRTGMSRPGPLLKFSQHAGRHILQSPSSPRWIAHSDGCVSLPCRRHRLPRAHRTGSTGRLPRRRGASHSRSRSRLAGNEGWVTSRQGSPNEGIFIALSCHQTPMQCVHTRHTSFFKKHISGLAISASHLKRQVLIESINQS
jgi:hypothetical protein